MFCLSLLVFIALSTMSGDRQRDEQTDRPRKELTSQHICRNEIYFLLREAILC